MKRFGLLKGARIIDNLERRSRGRGFTILELDELLTKHKNILAALRPQPVIMQSANQPYSENFPF
jgi:hypothetical protein